MSEKEPRSEGKSTGPRTPQGKKRSRYNAVKHGLLSKVLLLPLESPRKYESLLNGLREVCNPLGALEVTLVEEVATILWKKRRLVQAETAEISEAMAFSSRDLVSLQEEC